MEAQIPESYPKAVEVQKLPFTNIPPAELPLETLALPPHVRELIGGRPTETPNGADDPAEEAGRPVAPTAVLETPELAEQTPEIQRNKRPRELSESQLATADQYIAKCLQLEAEGNKVRGWKSRLAKSIDRHGAWVTKRIKHVQAPGPAGGGMNYRIKFGDLVTTLTPQAAALVEEHQLQCQRIDQEVSAQSIATAALLHAIEERIGSPTATADGHTKAESKRLVRQNHRHGGNGSF